jgi:FkbM family methyltransferase
MTSLTHKTKHWLRSALAPGWYHRIQQWKFATLNGYAQTTYSQTGEDIILRHFFIEQPTGFYVDVGAHHPRRFSNTWFFYRRNWRGINIDAMPGSMRAFERERARDINLELGVAQETGSLTFHVFDDPALNTFDADLAERRIVDGAQLQSTRMVRVQPLGQILDQHRPRNTPIDFLSIDVEGFDLAVLQSNAWDRHRPRCIVVECDGFDLNNPNTQPTHCYLTGLRYNLVAKTVVSAVYLSAS